MGLVPLPSTEVKNAKSYKLNLLPQYLHSVNKNNLHILLIWQDIKYRLFNVTMERNRVIIFHFVFWRFSIQISQEKLNIIVKVSQGFPQFLINFKEPNSSWEINCSSASQEISPLLRIPVVLMGNVTNKISFVLSECNCLVINYRQTTHSGIITFIYEEFYV